MTGRYGFVGGAGAGAGAGEFVAAVFVIAGFGAFVAWAGTTAATLVLVRETLWLVVAALVRFVAVLAGRFCRF